MGYLGCPVIPSVAPLSLSGGIRTAHDGMIESHSFQRRGQRRQQSWPMINRARPGRQQNFKKPKTVQANGWTTLYQCASPIRERKRDFSLRVGVITRRDWMMTIWRGPWSVVADSPRTPEDERKNTGGIAQGKEKKKILSSGTSTVDLSRW